MQEGKEEHPQKQHDKKTDQEEPDDPGSREQHSMSGSHKPHPPGVWHILLESFTSRQVAACIQGVKEQHALLCHFILFTK